ncbi:MAG TPA: response regulator transcription factor [Clostridiales bacterium]|nr:response regulator transcription factor [Clostridiales bacterium]
MAKELIYVLEDEEHIQQLIKYNLEANGYEVVGFQNGESLLKQIETSLPGLFILDIMLPGIDGLEVCKSIRRDQKLGTIPIIMLTAKSEELDKVLGLELGADDYITKPFSVRELTARVKALLRRVNALVPNGKEEEKEKEENKEDVIRYKDICIYTDRHEVYKSGKLIDLTLKEFDLLKILMLNKGKVLSRDLLLDKVWGFDYYGETRTVDVHIRYLRQKIEDDDSNPEYIETIRGVGYRFRDK